MRENLTSFFQGKKVLITGHTGFKGSWLSQILANWGAHIVGIALPPHTDPNLFSLLHLSEKIEKNYFQDIRDFERCASILENEQPEIVFHLAAQPLVRESYEDPLKTYTTNTIGTANILQAVHERGRSVKAVVVITTDKVYQNKEWVYPYRETDALGGYDPYSASKAAADIAAQSYISSFFSLQEFGAKHHALVAIARAGNVIGGGDWSKDRIVTDIVRSVFERKEKVLLRSPEAVRPWEHVLEPLSGYLELARVLYEGRKKFSGTWNFGPDDESFVDVRTLTEKALETLGQGEYEVQVSGDAKHEANILKLDTSKAKSILGWKPRLDLSGNIRFTFDWYKHYYTQPESIRSLTNDQIHLFFHWEQYKRYFLGE